MLTAQQAREITATKEFVTREHVYNSIATMVDHGFSFYWITGKIKEELKAELIENGYKLEQSEISNSTRISW